jgi:hypothetical protein
MTLTLTDTPTGNDLRSLPLSLRKTNLARLLALRPDGIFVAPFEQGENTRQETAISRM